MMESDCTDTRADSLQLLHSVPWGPEEAIAKPRRQLAGWPLVAGERRHGSRFEAVVPSGRSKSGLPIRLPSGGVLAADMVRDQCDEPCRCTLAGVREMWCRRAIWKSRMTAKDPPASLPAGNDASRSSSKGQAGLQETGEVSGGRSPRRLTRQPNQRVARLCILTQELGCMSGRVPHSRGADRVGG